MKKITALTCVLLMIFNIAGCGKKTEENEQPQEVTTPESEAVDTAETADTQEELEVNSDISGSIVWWTYPIFTANDDESAYTDTIIAEFQKRYPNIQVEVQNLDFNTGSDTIAAAIAENTTADVLFANASEIVPYAKSGLLTDLTELYTDEVKEDFRTQSLLDACQFNDSYYMFPLSISNYTMAFNKAMLEDSGVLELVPTDANGLWNAETFETVIQKLSEAGHTGGSLYCSSVAGDYGTRSFLTNLYGAKLMNEDLSSYTFEGDIPSQTLDKVKEWTKNGWMTEGSEANGGESLDDFVVGNTSFTLLWGGSQSIYYQDILSQNGVEAVEVPFPSDSGAASLEYIMNSFCIFNHDDEARTQAAKCFVNFICNDAGMISQNIVHTGAFSVKNSMQGLYTENETATYYETLTSYSGPFYQKVNGFDAMRVYWYKMLQSVMKDDTQSADALKTFDEQANKTLNQEAAQEAKTEPETP